MKKSHVEIRQIPTRTTVAQDQTTWGFMSESVKFRSRQRWHRSNDVWVEIFRLPRRLVLCHRRPSRNFYWPILHYIFSIYCFTVHVMSLPLWYTYSLCLRAPPPWFYSPSIHASQLVFFTTGNLRPDSSRTSSPIVPSFTWPIYIDPCCGSRNFWYFVKGILYCLPYIDKPLYWCFNLCLLKLLWSSSRNYSSDSK